MTKAIRYGLFRWLGGLLVVITLYILSFGPVLHLCGTLVGDGWPSLPGVVRFTYAPLVQTTRGRMLGSGDRNVRRRHPCGKGSAGATGGPARDSWGVA